MQGLLKIVVIQPQIFCNHCTNKNSFVKFLADYSSLKRNEVLIHVTAWMNPENIMLHVRSTVENKTQKNKYCMVALI